MNGRSRQRNLIAPPPVLFEKQVRREDLRSTKNRLWRFTHTHCEGNLLGLPPGEPKDWGAVSIQDLKDVHTFRVDPQHDACLGPLLREDPVEVDPVLCQPLAHLQGQTQYSKTMAQDRDQL